jgi:CheY-like chemotaxis protein
MLILVADDEGSVRLLVRKLLQNHIVLEASDGEQAVAITRSRRPDLILMDILMPKVDGYTACSRIKTDQATEGIPVVMLTGLDHELNKNLAKAVGADGYITKPFSLKELQRTIDRL